MQLIVLGSGTVAPASDRTASAYWLTTGDTKLLLECGAGTLHRAAQLSVPWHQATHIGVSHFHIDHWGELPAVIFAMRWGIEPSRVEPLTLIGPAGLLTRLRLLAGALGDWVLKPGFPLHVTEVDPGTEQPLSGDAVIETHKTPHTEQSLAYAVRDREARLVYTADTGPDDSLAEWAQGCDLLLAECSLPDHRPLDVHLTPTRAGDLACKAEARELVLTHFYPVFGDIDPVEIARRSFGGPVTAASDGDRFLITKGPA